MISFVCWKWHAPDSTREFRSEHVNVLRAMVRRHYRHPHRFICMTDEPAGLGPDIEAIPCPVTFSQVSAPQGGRFPSCYRRLWVFSKEARAVLGDRIMCLDIDVVIVRDITQLAHSHTHNFVGWTDSRFGWQKIAGGVYMLRTGTHPEVWEEFDPVESPKLAAAAGFKGSDQAWMSFRLYPPEGAWTTTDGLYKIGWLGRNRRKQTVSARIPTTARMVFTAGHSPPWLAEEQRRHPWIAQHWKL